MLKHKEVNPLSVFGLRQLDYLPPHFTPVFFELKSHEKTVSDWIWTNLSGRFYYGDYYYKEADSTVQMHRCAAFEIAAEASMFALVLDQINTFQFEF